MASSAPTSRDSWRGLFGLKLPLALKLILVTEFLLLVAIVVMLAPVRWKMRDQVVGDLQAELRSIAAVAALQLDGDALRVVRTKADARTAEFHRQQKVLTRIRDQAGLTQDNIYTLYQDDGGKVRFGVMTHVVPFVGESLVGHEWLRPAFDRAEITTSPLYTDENGQWISAFAPVRDSRGDVVAVLEVNRPAAAYFARYTQVQNITIAIALAALGVSSLLGLYVVDRVVLRPMRAVRGGMQALARQDFTHQVALRSQDEFEDLADLLNDLSRQLNAAKLVAQGFTPKELPSPPGWTIAALTEPCEATAGDYFDAFELPPGPDGSPGGTAVLVADVTGHGLGPSLHMSACRSALRALASTGLPPADLLARLDLLLQNDLEGGRFITLLYGTLYPDGRFTFCNAGHGPALLFRNSDLAAASVSGSGVPPTLTLDAHRPPLGIPWDLIPGEEPQTTLLLQPGDRLLLCSDGVSEAMDPRGEQLGTDPLCVLLADATLTAPTLVTRLRDTVTTHCRGRSKTDDVTILCVQRTA